MSADLTIGPPLRHVEHVMGTAFSFDIRDADRLRPGALDDVIAWLHWVDDVFSTYQPTSHVSRLSRGEIRLADCPAEVADVLQMCAAIGAETGGYFSALPGGRLDPSGYVKGWAIQRASEMLRAAGSQRHCVNGGGDVQVAGEVSPGNPWRIGILDPLHLGSIVTVVAGRDLAVATSGTSERGGHVLNPFTGRPATELASLTVVGAGIARADAYATAAFAMGRAAYDWLEGLLGYEGFGISAAGDVWCTSGWALVAGHGLPEMLDRARVW